MAATARHPGNTMRLAVLVAALVLGGTAPALAQSAASQDSYDQDSYDQDSYDAADPSGPVRASISVDKTATPSTVPEPGGDVVFAVTVHNESGGGPVELQSLVDDVHGDLDGRGSCEVPVILEAGAVYRCSFVARVIGAPGFVEVDTVTAAGVDAEGAPVVASGSASVTVADVPAVLRVAKRATPGAVPETGGEVTFIVRVKNVSEVDTVTVRSVVDDVFGDVSSSCTVELPHDLEPGATFSCRFTEAVAGAVDRPHVNVVTVTGTDDDGHTVSTSDDATVQFESEPLIDLEVMLEFGDASVSVGSASGLHLVVANRGPADATGVVVQQTLPPGVASVVASAGAAYDPATGLWNLGTLPAGASVGLELTTNVTEAGRHVAAAEVVAADQRDVDSTPGDGSGDDWDDATIAATRVLAVSSLGDTVWIDGDADGSMDGDEGGFAGVEVRMTLPDGSHRWATTDADGRYLFVGLPAGEYRVTVVAPEGWATTTAATRRVSLAGDDAYLGADFGLARALPATGMPIEALTGVGLLMVLSGAAALHAGRRRRGVEIPNR